LEGCSRFTLDTGLEGGTKEERKLEEGDRGGHGQWEVNSMEVNGFQRGPVRAGRDSDPERTCFAKMGNQAQQNKAQERGKVW
jgi:predicted NBD/HSP70 family sugar kinase